MVCIYCNSKIKTAVVNSRVSAKTVGVWRRRRCLHCASIITTREQLDYENALRVQKNDSLQPFQRDNLFISVYNSVSHRKTALNDATQLTATIITALLKLQTNGVLERRHIIEATLTVLQHFDKAASVHYAAHHEKIRL